MKPASEQAAERPYDYDLVFPEGSPPTRERTDSAGPMGTKLQDMMDKIMSRAA
jgi:hypothetical protein